MKEIMLKKCETYIIYLYDYLGNLIGFKQLYEDTESNLYELFFRATIEDQELEINLEEDNWESVADREKPLEIFMGKGFNDEEGTIIKDHYHLVDCEIIDGCYFNASLYLFDEYIEKYKKIKMKSKGAVRQIAKLFLNNLYGKTATSPDSSYKIAYLKEDGSLGFYTQLEENKKTVYIAVTSYARNFYSCDKGGFGYVDTDSCDIDNMSIKEIKGVKLHDTEFLCWKCESCCIFYGRKIRKSYNQSTESIRFRL